MSDEATPAAADQIPVPGRALPDYYYTPEYVATAKKKDSWWPLIGLVLTAALVVLAFVGGMSGSDNPGNRCDGYSDNEIVASPYTACRDGAGNATTTSQYSQNKEFYNKLKQAERDYILGK